MSILSVSLTPEIEEFIAREMESGEFESKGQLVKKALKRFEEDLIVERILKASQKSKEGEIFQGDLKELAKKIR